MITDQDFLILWIEPQQPPSAMPVIDELTRIMAAAFWETKPGVKGARKGLFRFGTYRKSHRCSCGVYSSQQDYQLPNGCVVNSLAVHYLAWHRAEIGKTQLELVESLRDLVTRPVGPTSVQLARPPANL
ncbi:MAG TPA: hypothetical protein VH144_00490 [Candidatus Saccharimonadales bacterium]|jgi:hypothetical protein|nr:hypothetical protein [Candidatus Saccharimonadales bacterium]